MFNTFYTLHSRRNINKKCIDLFSNCVCPYLKQFVFYLCKKWLKIPIISLSDDITEKIEDMCISCLNHIFSKFIKYNS